MRAAALAVALMALLPWILFGQTTTSGESTSSTSQPASSSSSQAASSGQPSTSQPSSSGAPQPVPYSPDEFPLWLRQVRRAEVITIGAFPIALLVSSLGYQTVRYAQHGYSRDYSPSLFGNSAQPLSNQEKIGILLGAVGLSASVALADFIVGKLTQPSSTGTKP